MDVTVSSTGGTPSSLSVSVFLVEAFFGVVKLGLLIIGVSVTSVLDETGGDRI